MLTTLDHLEHHIHHRQKKNFFSSFGKEIKGFSIFFLIVFILNSVFVNAQLYQEAIMDIVHQLSGSTNNPTGNSVIGSFISSHQDDLLDKDFIQKKMKLDQITQSVNSMTTVKANDFV
jgi:hypothetical protein